VIGIIAVLISMLLPVVTRVRETAKQTECLSNLRGLGSAMLAYTNDNDGVLPAGARITDPIAEDWIYWQSNRTVSKSAIARYLSPTPPQALRCPSDDFAIREVQMGYLFSYVMNSALAPVTTHAYGLPMRKVKTAGRTILAFEEDASTSNDGYGILDPSQTGQDLLAAYHDGRRQSPDDLTHDTANSPNITWGGNVVFCDGHGEFISRQDAQSPAFFNPAF
jgi:prepilin-type processing-associated H-X9-DG protein